MLECYGQTVAAKVTVEYIVRLSARTLFEKADSRKPINHEGEEPVPYEGQLASNQ